MLGPGLVGADRQPGEIEARELPVGQRVGELRERPTGGEMGADREHVGAQHRVAGVGGGRDLREHVRVRFDDPVNGWAPYARAGIRTIPFPCEHLELVDEPPPGVGRALQNEIDRACANTARAAKPRDPLRDPTRSTPASVRHP